MSSPPVSAVPVARAVLESPIGRLTLLASEIGVCSVLFAGGGGRPAGVASWVPEGTGSQLLRCARDELGQYFAGARTAFDLALDLVGTPFQRRVWAEVQRVPYGETVSYGELARRVGCPSGARAVGGANARNPVPILVPCHRVVGARGELTGFGGGLERKRFLLTLESGGGAARSAAGRPR